MTDIVEKETNPQAGESPASGAARSARRLPVWVMIVAFLVLAGFMALIGNGLKRSMQGAIAIGEPVPSFSLTTFDGKNIDTAQYAGKVVFINFWASWCQPCAQEARELEEAYQHYKSGGDVLFLGLTYVDTEPKSLAYMQQYGITYANGPDLATKTSQMFRVKGVPETYIIDRNGKLAFVKIGPFSSTEEIIAAVEQVLAK